MDEKQKRKSDAHKQLLADLERAGLKGKIDGFWVLDGPVPEGGFPNLVAPDQWPDSPEDQTPTP